MSISSYTGNQITKSTSTDENGNKSIFFADKEGRTLESWVQVSGDGSQPNHYLITTYLYDYLNRPVAVIPPKLYGQIPDVTELLTSPFLNLLHYSVYDSRGRVVEKHTPDAGWTYLVYNRLGQVVLSQNARHRATNLWLWSKYGARGQNILSGTLVQNTYTRVQLQTLFDNYTEDKQFEERIPTGGQEGYTIRSFPSPIQAFVISNNIKIVNYYDNYGWFIGAETTQLAFQKYKTNRWSNAKGLMTGNKVRRLDTNAWLVSAMYYDDKNRLIQTQSQNRYGLVNQTDIVLDFIGQLLENRTIYRKQVSSLSNTVEVATKYSYDHTGRKLSTTHFLNGKPELLASYEYDELGRLVQKNLNEASVNTITRNQVVAKSQVIDAAKKYVLLLPGTRIKGDSVYCALIASGLQKISYSYDIRGNIRCINCDNAGNLDNAKVFALKLDYHQDGRYYNGLLSRTSWKSSADTVTRKYSFSYDKSYRLSKGDFTGKSPENYSLPKIRYDANGNIDSLQRNGKTGMNTYALIDDLKYNYSQNSNRLAAIDDNANANLGFKNVVGTNEYSYNTNGDQTADNNKGITNIDYNYLGLIDKVYFGATKRIENIYTADGQKLSTKFINGSTILAKEYIGDLIYINDTLRSIWHDEGRITFNNTGQGTYQYFINDHQGSTRVVFQKLNGNTYIAQRIDYGVTGDIISENAGQNLLTHLFQGKEFYDGFGYDFVTRTYDPYTVRMLQIDGANQFASGYTGMGNMPNMGVDPDGQWLHIAAGAVIGGAINLGVKAYQGKINSWKDGFAAFGIGAAAGAITAATGGAAAGALGLGSTGVLSGAVVGFAGSAVGDPIRGLGNAAYFHDSYSLKDYGTGIITGGVVGGAFGGASALLKGANFWNGGPRAFNVGAFNPNNNQFLREQGWSRAGNGRWSRVSVNELIFDGAETGVNGELSDFAGVKIGDVIAGEKTMAKQLHFLRINPNSSAGWKSLNPNDAEHYFSSIVENYTSIASKYTIKGGDGMYRSLYQLDGSLRGKGGIFEWIVETGGSINHRRFIVGGNVNGRIGGR